MAPTRTALASALLTSFALLHSGPALAQVSTIATPQGFSGKETLITFEGQGVSGPPYVTTLSGATFSEGSTPRVSIGSDDATRPFGPQDPIIVDNRGTRQPLAIAFAAPMTRVGFELRYNVCNARASVHFLRAGATVGAAQTGLSQSADPSEPAACSPAAWAFAAFESVEPFDRVVITGPAGGYVRLDNVRFEDASPPPAVISPLPDPTAFSAQATLITFQGQVGPMIGSLSGATFAAGSTPSMALGMDDRPRPFGPNDPMVVDNRADMSQPVSIGFATPVTRVAFESSYNGCGQTLLVEFLAGTTVIGSARSPASPPMPGNNCSPGHFVFAGFRSTRPFDRIRITSGGYLRVDNVRFER